MTTGQQSSIIINVQANTQQAQQQVWQLNVQVQNTGQVAQQSTQRAQTAFEKLKKKIKETLTSVSGLQGIFEAVMGGAVLKSMGDAIKSTESLNNQLAVLRSNANFEGIAQDFNANKEITGGLANEFDMVGGISRAMAFNIDLSGGKLRELIDVAQKTAIVMGTDLKTAFDDLITGVSRGSVPILDNLGIVISLDEANQKFANTLGKSTDAMSKAEKTTALLNEVILKLKQNTANVDMGQLEQSGTKAVKTLEDSLNKAKMTVAKGFVDFGTFLGEGMAELLMDSEELAYLKLAEMQKEEEEKFKKNFSDLIKWMNQQDVRFATGMVEGENEQTSASQNLQIQFDKNRFKDEDEIEAEKEKKRQSRFKKTQEKYDTDIDAIKKQNERIKKLNEETAKIWEQAGLFGLSDIEKSQEKIKKLKDEFDKIGSGKLADAEREKKKAEIFSAEQELSASEIKLEQEKQKQIQDSIKETYDLENQLAELNKEHNNKIREEEKKIADMNMKDKEKYFNILSGLMSDSIDAIFEGSKENFLNALLGFANTFGTTLIMDGIKTMLMGTAKNSIFPGLGATAMGVGAAEISIGTAMKAGAYIGGSFMSPSTTEGQSATEKNQGQNQNIVMNVQTSLYGSKKEAQKGLSEVMK